MAQSDESELSILLPQPPKELAAGAHSFVLVLNFSSLHTPFRHAGFRREIGIGRVVDNSWHMLSLAVHCSFVDSVST